MSAWLLMLGVLTFAPAVFGQAMSQGIMSPPANIRPPGLKNVGIEQHLDEQIPPGLEFRDETGKAVRLGDYFGQRPIILNLVYYQCPMLCGEVPEMAAAKKADYLKRYGRPSAAAGWHFLTGPKESIDALTKAAGFQYQYDPTTGQFAHTTAIMVLTPAGKISQYYYGIEYAPKDLRLGLVQASENRIGTVVDQVLLYCYHYNPDTGKYGAVISRILRLAALATMLMVGILLAVLFHKEDARGRRA